MFLCAPPQVDCERCTRKLLSPFEQTGAEALFPFTRPPYQGGPNFEIIYRCAQQSVSRRHSQIAKRRGVSRVIFLKFPVPNVKQSCVWKNHTSKKISAQTGFLSTAHKVMHRFHTGKIFFQESEKNAKNFPESTKRQNFFHRIAESNPNPRRDSDSIFFQKSAELRRFPLPRLAIRIDSRLSRDSPDLSARIKNIFKCRDRRAGAVHYFPVSSPPFCRLFPGFSVDLPPARERQGRNGERGVERGGGFPAGGAVAKVNIFSFAARFPGTNPGTKIGPDHEKPLFFGRRGL